MTNFKKTPDGKPQSQQPQGKQDYRSKLDAILAKAGENNPIAKAQAKSVPKPQSPAAAVPPPSVPPAAQAAQPAAPQTGAPVPQDPSQKLQQILAMAGQTPAQRAQYQAKQKAQQSSQQSSAAFSAGVQAYLQALQQDPRKMLRAEAEFGGVGNTDEYYLRCYADAQGNVFWDLSGEDVDYQLQSTPIHQYGLYDNYYRGVPDAVMRQAFASAQQVSCTVV